MNQNHDDPVYLFWLLLAGVLIAVVLVGFIGALSQMVKP